ncbi:MAG: LCP family protein [Lachnospiraceae bacterium]|nr:LCP family protein [Lachnospiraceae bacterium]
MEDSRNNNRRQGSGQRQAAQNGRRKPAPAGRAPQGNKRPAQNSRPQSEGTRPVQHKRPPQGGKGQVNNRKKQPMTQKQAQKKKRNKIILFVAEIFVLLILLVVFWGMDKVRKINIVDIKEEDIVINPEVVEETETGAMKGYRNIALFGVDSRDKQLDKATRTDVIKIVSINEDTGEVKLVSVYRDSFLNLSTDTYNKANLAYAKGGPKQALAMLNMNMDMNITDFVTIGFDGLIDVIDAVGGVEIDVKESEVVHLNSYQISMVGKQDGVNAKGEPNYVATAGVDYTPVTKSGLQTLNGLQATAYCRIRYVGNDFERTQRQNAVLKQVAKKAMTLNPSTLNKIAEAVFPKVATSLELSEIIELLGGITKYSIGETAGFPFDGHFATGMIGKKGSCVVPTTLEDNVILLHQFFFGSEEGYEPSETVKNCSQKIQSETSAYIK